MAAAVGHCGRCSAADALVTLHLVRMGVNRVAISFSKCLGVQTWASNDTVQRAWRLALSLRVRCPLLATPIAGRQSEKWLRARIAMRVHIDTCMLKPGRLCPIAALRDISGWAHLNPPARLQCACVG